MVRRGRGYECSRGLLVPRQRLVRVPCQFYFMPDTNYSYHFNEAEWIKLLFTLADTQEWINRMNTDLFRQIPVSKKGLISNDYYLSVTAVAHIIIRHYYKMNRYPHASKFNIPVIDILYLIRDAYFVTPVPIDGNLFQRTMETATPIGYDKYGIETNILSVITDAGGKIITAYPGKVLDE